MFRTRALLVVVALLALPMRAPAAEAPPPLLLEWGSYGQEPGQFNHPWDVAVDAAGNVYVADGWGQRVQKFNSEGGFIRAWGSMGQDPGQFCDPFGIAVAPDGSVYVSENCNQRVSRFTPDGELIGTFPVSGSADGLTVDASGNVIVAETGNHTVAKFTSEGFLIRRWGSYGAAAGQFYWPTGVATDQQGNIYIGDQGNHRVQKFTSNGAFLMQWGSNGGGDGQFNYPGGIALDAVGNVYVCDVANARIQKFTGSGQFLTKWTAFDWPTGLDVDPTGNVYVAQYWTYHKIQKFGFCPSRNEITSFLPGPGTSQTSAWQSVGPADGRGTPLGYQGRLVVHFPDGISDGTGPDIRVVELGHSGPPAIDENYRVEVSADGSTFTSIGDAAGDIANFDLAGSGVSLAHFVRVTDLPPFEQASIPNYDPTVVGADIDAVVAIHCPRNEANCSNGLDDDADGLPDCADTDCGIDADHDGYFALPCGQDCNDTDARIHPGATENCTDGIDNDCDGLVDCNDPDCNVADADADGIPDCTDTCPTPGLRCQDVTALVGGAADPDNRWDIVFAYDSRMSSPSWISQLNSEIVSVWNAFRSIPSLTPYMGNVTFWRYQRKTSYPYDDVREALARYRLDAMVVRIPSGLKCMSKSEFTDCTDTSHQPPAAILSHDPRTDVRVALHEIGHAAFGLSDEYWRDGLIVTCGTKYCRDRGYRVRADMPAGNVWRSAADCEEAASRYCFNAPCYEFCEENGQRRWRLGQSANPNLMRYNCEPQVGVTFGEAGDLRVQQMLGRPNTACFSPLVAHDTTTVGVPPRSLTATLGVGRAAAVLDSASVDSGFVVTPAPAGTPLYVRMLNIRGEELGTTWIWDPRFLTAHDSVAVDEIVPITLRVPVPDGATAVQLMDRDSVVLGEWGLSAALQDYCLRINGTDAICLAADDDDDGVPDSFDNCPHFANPSQADQNGNGVGDACEHLLEVDHETPPTSVLISRAVPNPTPGGTQLRMALPSAGLLRVAIYDVSGRRVRNIAEEWHEAGEHTLSWDGSDESGRRALSGVYFCRISFAGQSWTRTIVLAR